MADNMPRCAAPQGVKTEDEGENEDDFRLNYGEDSVPKLC